MDNGNNLHWTQEALGPPHFNTASERPLGLTLIALLYFPLVALFLLLPVKYLLDESIDFGIISPFFCLVLALESIIFAVSASLWYLVAWARFATLGLAALIILVQT